TYGDSASLGYSVGCHSGLSVLDAHSGGRSADIYDTASPAYSAAFPQARLKQGGNWVGNTGYGYGDSDLVGYSERLALLFTDAIGRQIKNSSHVYIGAPLRQWPARAPR